MKKYIVISFTALAIMTFLEPLPAIHFTGADAMAQTETKDHDFPVQKSEDQWKKELTKEEFRVLRMEGTEPPHSSPLNDEKRSGVFVCAACGHELYPSSTKFESGSGWPSFYKPIREDAIGTRTDYKLIWPRTEVHCANCGGHLGHVFEDGPEPTGLRHCINGVALDFEPKQNAGQ